MLFKFIGDYTNGHTSISIGGVTFEGREPSEVPGELVARFSNHPEFEKAAPLGHDGEPKAPARKKKATT